MNVSENTRTWLDNAFWETPKKLVLNAICEFEDEEKGRTIRQVMKMRRYDDDGKENPDFIECLNYLGEVTIAKSTEERRERKLSEMQKENERKLEEQKAHKMEQLFEYKLGLFEIPEIKNTTQRNLRAKLRRSKSIPEANIYSMLIMKHELEESGEL